MSPNNKAVRARIIFILLMTAMLVRIIHERAAKCRLEIVLAA